MERGFVTYQRDYTDKSRPVSRVERPKSSARSLKSRGGTASNRKAYAEQPLQDSSPEEHIIQRPKSSRKSWADNLGIFVITVNRRAINIFLKVIMTIYLLSRQIPFQITPKILILRSLQTQAV